MKLISTKFDHNGNIPLRYTGESDNASPPLEWRDVPEGCRSLVLICEDVDVLDETHEKQVFTHWLIYNIPAKVTTLPEGIPWGAKLQSPLLAHQGKNSFGHIGYEGPLPPFADGTHHYVFTLYALKNDLVAHPGCEKKELISSMRGKNNVLATAVLVGSYTRAYRQVA